MAKKEFTYRGRSEQELYTMSLKELSALLPSAARRKIRRGFTDAEKELLKSIKTSKKPVKTHCRDMIVIPEMFNKQLKVHSGKAFEDLLVTSEMIGHKLGEFIQTRKKVSHSAPGIGATKSSANVSVK